MIKELWIEYQLVNKFIRRMNIHPNERVYTRREELREQLGNLIRESVYPISPTSFLVKCGYGDDYSIEERQLYVADTH